MQNEDQQGRVGRMSDDTSGTEISESEKDPEHLPAKIAGNLVKKDVSPHIEGFVEAFTKFKIETKQVWSVFSCPLGIVRCLNEIEATIFLWRKMYSASLAWLNDVWAF